MLLAILNLDEKKPEPLVGILDLVRKSGKPWAAVITKSDLATVDRIGFLRAELLPDNVPIVEVCATKNPKEALELVMSMVRAMLPESQGPLFDVDILTTENVREMAAEIIREKCFEELGEEIPYGLGIKIQSFKEVAGRMTEILADIVVDKASHKPIVVGKGGAKIKTIGMKARLDIEKLLDNRVFLETHVVVKEKWTRSPSLMKEMGYVVQE